MTTTQDGAERLLRLADACEKATGPDRGLDCAISDAVQDREWETEGDRLFYTASLDSAMTLVPEGLSVTLYAHGDNAHCDIYAGHPSRGLLAEVEMAATPALALCAASLRARSTEASNG